MGSVMDSSILPERARDEDENAGRGLQRRVGPPEVLRSIAGVIAVAAAVVGLLSKLDAPAATRPATPAAVALPAVSHVVYGAPSVAALRPAVSLSGEARRVCSDQLRPRPRSGAWHCNGGRTLGLDEIGVQANDPGGPCTHRTTESGGASWQCRTRIAIPKVALGMPYGIPVFFGDLRPGTGVVQRHVDGLCWQEVRPSLRASWRCAVGSWRSLDPGYRAVQAVDPGGRCLERMVDEETGVWWCTSRP
jgi:hypothetical protein